MKNAYAAGIGGPRLEQLTLTQSFVSVALRMWMAMVSHETSLDQYE
jgi:hypothetical protein